jgi:hypothetical protein
MSARTQRVAPAELQMQTYRCMQLTLLSHSHTCSTEDVESSHTDDNVLAEALPGQAEQPRTHVAQSTCISKDCLTSHAGQSTAASRWSWTLPVVVCGVSRLCVLLMSAASEADAPQLEPRQRSDTVGMRIKNVISSVCVASMFRSHSPRAM